MPTPRGIRNNNPGNIDWNSRINWVGQTGRESGSGARFATFDTMENGIRALARNLMTYFQRYNLDSVGEIIGRWAPSNENNTGAYARQVANALGVGVNDRINVLDPSTLSGLTEAIIRHENGGLFGITDAQIMNGVNRALGNSASPLEVVALETGPPSEKRLKAHSILSQVQIHLEKSSELLSDLQKLLTQ